MCCCWLRLGPARGLCRGLRRRDRADLERDELDYRRAKDKSDKSLELYKFYVNALYVAMTRAVESLTLVEADTGHPLLDLLGLQLGEAVAQPAARHPPRRSGRRRRAGSSCRASRSRRRPSATPSCSTSRCRGRRGAGLDRGPVPQGAWTRGNPSSQAEADPVRLCAVARPACLGRIAGARRICRRPAGWREEQSSAGAATLPRVTASMAPGWRGSSWCAAPWPPCSSATCRPTRPRTSRTSCGCADLHGLDHATPVGATPLMLAAMRRQRAARRSAA